MKHCPSCNTEKAAESFWNLASSRDGKQARCKDCQRASRERYRLANPGEERAKASARYWAQKTQHNANSRKNHLRRTFGLTLEQYDKMLADQNGGCAICAAPPSRGRSLAVDHHHESGKVRALLCDRCNRLIGLAEENWTLLSDAASYVCGHNTRPHLPEALDAPGVRITVMRVEQAAA